MAELSTKAMTAVFMIIGIILSVVIITSTYPTVSSKLADFETQVNNSNNTLTRDIGGAIVQFVDPLYVVGVAGGLIAAAYQVGKKLFS